MKYAFMSYSVPEMTLEQALEAASRWGYDGFEPRVASEHAHGVERSLDADQRRAIRETVESSGVALCCLATGCCYADLSSIDQQIDDTHAYIDLAGDLGCPRMRVFGGRFDEWLMREDAIDVVADSLRLVADHAQERGVTLCLETHDDWCDPDHVAAVMNLVKHPNVGVNWDVMHPTRSADKSIDQAYQTLQPWIRHVHVHDGVNTTDRLEFKAIGEGDFDHRRVIELLQQDGYDGFLSGEWIDWEPGETHLPREIQTLRSYETQKV